MNAKPQNKYRSTVQRFDRYPLLFDAIAVILYHVNTGIRHGQPVHMSVGPFALVAHEYRGQELSINGLRSILLHYDIVSSDSAVSSNFIKLKHRKVYDIFESGEFVYTCQTGTFHFKINTDGTLDEIFSEYDGRTPEFIEQLVNDFPENNYSPCELLRREISTKHLIDTQAFLAGLNPWLPVYIEVD